MNDLYNKKSYIKYIKYKIINFFNNDSLIRLSINNKLKDYLILISSSTNKLWNLHCTLSKIIIKMNDKYDSYDYGSGYFYQSLKKINITGFRDTESRVKKLEIRELVKNKKVLDIGTNTGFILFSSYKSFNHAIGIEHNCYLIEIAENVKKYLNVKNIEFKCINFENYAKKTKTKFDVILSLANHSTFDGNTKQNIQDYFLNTSKLLNPKGILIFESHPPQIEPPEKLEKTINAIQKNYIIIKKPLIKMDGFLDKKRSYLIAQKK